MTRPDGPDRADHVDRIVAQWERERPDLDASPIRVIGRVSRLSRTIDRQLQRVFDEHGLENWEYDVLATLRRQGAPYELTAGDLLAASMITSGAVTNRIDRLEQRGYVQRARDASDRRVVRIRLTAAGRAAIDAATPDHLRNEAAIVAALSATERRQLERLLRRLQQHLDELEHGATP